MTGAEQRSEKRVPHCAHVTVRVRSTPESPDPDDTAFTCITIDVAESGVRLKTERTLPVDSLLDLDVTLLERVFALAGRVVWSVDVADNKSFAGVRFTAEDARLWPWKLEVARAFRAARPS